MLRDNLKRREGLLQSATNREISEHSHAYYDYKDIVFSAGSEVVVSSLTGSIVGQILPIEPLYFIEAVEAKLYFTGKYSGGDSYTLSLYCNGLIYTVTKSDALMYENISYNINEELKSVFKNSNEYNMYVTAKVSNAANALGIYGLTLRIYTSAKDTFGSYNNKAKQYLSNTGLLEKQYLVDQSLKDEKWGYISELRDQFSGR